MKLTLGFSACPNDTFIFDALVHNKIDTEGFVFDVVMEDVEALNKMARAGKLDITKLSFHAYAYASSDYILLNAGSALGKGCGPLLISKDPIPVSRVADCVVGIPGRMTTANLLFSLAFPDAITKKELLFSDIEQELLDDRIDAGVIIHENRFTYEGKGLQKIMDLGAYWETNYHVPVPLGGIAANRSLGDNTIKTVDRLIRNSVAFAFENRESSAKYTAEHAQEMDKSVMEQHINLYVNEYSHDLGDEGRRAIERMYETAMGIRFIPGITRPLFIDSQ